LKERETQDFISSHHYDGQRLL